MSPKVAHSMQSPARKGKPPVRFLCGWQARRPSRKGRPVHRPGGADPAAVPGLLVETANGPVKSCAAAPRDNLDDLPWIVVWAIDGFAPLRESVHLERGEEALVDTLDDWLVPYLAGVRKAAAAGLIDPGATIVAVLTGSGLKDPATGASLAAPMLEAEPTAESVRATLGW